MPDLKIRKVLSLAESKRAILDRDYCQVVIGGGPLMSTIGECTDLLEMFIHAKSIGARTVIGGCGIGPLLVPFRNTAISALLRLADSVVLRDKASADLAKSALGFEGSVSIALDPAFVWIHENRDRSTAKENKLILLALRDWPIDEYAVGVSREEAITIKSNFETELGFFVDELYKIKPDIQILPFCMHKLAVGGDDRDFYRRVFKNHPLIISSLEDKHISPKQDLINFERSTAVLAMRFHSVVFSLGTLTPFLAIDYTLGGKIKGLLSDFDEQERLLELRTFDGRQAARKLLEISPISNESLDSLVRNTSEILQKEVWTSEGSPN
jgi:polysaccharide pyruvyl transferase WcaK-like protein